MDFSEGDRVKLVQKVDRYPHFVVPTGAEGTVVKNNEELLAVRIDTEVEGADEWNNEVHWYWGEHKPEKDLRLM